MGVREETLRAQDWGEEHRAVVCRFVGSAEAHGGEIAGVETAGDDAGDRFAE